MLASLGQAASGGRPEPLVERNRNRRLIDHLDHTETDGEFVVLPAALIILRQHALEVLADRHANFDVAAPGLDLVVAGVGKSKDANLAAGQVAADAIIDLDAVPAMNHE